MLISVRKLLRRATRTVIESLETRAMFALTTVIVPEPVGTPNEAPKIQTMPAVVVEKNATSRTASVLSMAYDAEQDPLSVGSFTQPAHGTVVSNGDGSFNYTPTTNYTGVDSFNYTVTDGRGGNATKTLNLSVVTRNTTQGSASYINFANVQAAGVDIDLASAAGAPRLVDFDADGDLDLLVATGGNVRYYRNTGTTTSAVFAAATNVAANGSAIALGAGTYDFAYTDVTGDGKPDIVLSKSSDNKLRLYVNTTTVAATPTFAAAVIIKNASNADFVASNWRFDIADWNGDSKADLVVGTFSGNVAIYYGIGTASLPAFSTSTTALDVTGKTVAGSYNLTPRFKDVNQDGRLDLLVSYNWGNIDYYLNIGTATSPALGTTSRTFQSIEGTLGITDSAGVSPDLHAGSDGPKYDFGDLNGDGTLDIVVGPENAGNKIYSAQGRSSTQILADIHAYFTAHPADLFVYLNANPTEQSKMNLLLQQLYGQDVSFASPWERQAIFDTMIADINAYPAYLKKQTWNMTANPGIQSFAAQWWIIAMESMFDSVYHRTQLADATNMTGYYRNAMIELGVIWGDNGLAPNNAEAIYKWLITTPHEIWPTPIITGGSGAGEWFGPRTYLTRARTTKNVFAYQFGGPDGENPFGSDSNVIGDRAVSVIFMNVLTHEITHDTDAYVSWLGGDYYRRWRQVLVYAGGHDAAGNNYIQADANGNYSESLTKAYWQTKGWYNGTDPWYVGDGTGVMEHFYQDTTGIGYGWHNFGFMRGSPEWFLYSSQESLATQANQNFVSSEGRLLIALDRWKHGYDSDVTEVIHFFDVWSAGLNKIKLYDIHPIDGGTDSLQQIEIASLHRDANNHIDQISVSGRVYRFTVDATGRVTGVINVSPSANADQLILDKGYWETPNVLANDTDWDGDALSVTGFTQPTNGSVVSNGDGTFTFTPNANFTGTDSFTYTITDGTDSATGTVQIQRGKTAILQTWWNVSGTLVTNLTGSFYYPGLPSEQTFITRTEAPVNRADNFGQRMIGYIVPPTTGNYVFWMASDDYGEFWLSTTSSPANVIKRASVSGYTGSRVYTTYASQKSATLALTGGTKYYFMAISKEGGGGDNLSVAWQGPSFSQQIITADYLAPYTDNLAPAVHNIAKVSQLSSTTVGLSVLGGDDKGEHELIYTWTCTSKPVGASDPVITGNGTNAAKNAVATLSRSGAYLFNVTISDPAGLTVSSSVGTTITAVAAGVSVTPAAPTVVIGATQQFTASLVDQFGIAMSGTVNWSASKGSITAGGLFTAPNLPGTCLVQAKIGSLYSRVVVTLTAAPPVAPSNLTVKKNTPTTLALLFKDNATTETGFTIQQGIRSASGAMVWTNIGSRGSQSGSGTQITYTIGSTYTPGTYYFRVRAYNASYFSAWSNTATVTV